MWLDTVLSTDLALQYGLGTGWRHHWLKSFERLGLTFVRENKYIVNPCCNL